MGLRLLRFALALLMIPACLDIRANKGGGMEPAGQPAGGAGISVQTGGSPGSGGSSCVAEGTRIATPSGERPIEDLRVGDEVLSYNEQTETVTVNRVRATRSAQRKVGVLSLPHAGRLRATVEHPIYESTAGTYLRADSFSEGAVPLRQMRRSSRSASTRAVRTVST